MRSRLRVFLLLALLLFIVHFIAQLYVADRLTDALHRNGPIDDLFAPSFAAASLTLPFLRWSVLESVAIALLLAAMFVFLRWRAVLAIVVAVPILIIGGMIATAKIVEWRVESGFRELAPRPIQPAERGTLATTLGDGQFTPLHDYLASQIARDDANVDPLPQEVDWFMVAHRPEIEALKHQLPANTGRAARFRMQKILLVDALQTHSFEDVVAAERLTEALLHQASIDSALYAIAATKNQIGVIRKLGAPAAAPVPSFDPHQQLIDAIAATAANILKLKSPWYAWPYAELCKAESSYSGLQQARIILNLRGMTFTMPPAEEARPKVPFNPIGVLTDGARFAWQANDLVNQRARTRS